MGSTPATLLEREHWGAWSGKSGEGECIIKLFVAWLHPSIQARAGCCVFWSRRMDFRRRLRVPTWPLLRTSWGGLTSTVWLLLTALFPRCDGASLVLNADHLMTARSLAHHGLRRLTRFRSNTPPTSGRSSSRTSRIP